MTWVSAGNDVGEYGNDVGGCGNDGRGAGTTGETGGNRTDRRWVWDAVGARGLEHRDARGATTLSS